MRKVILFSVLIAATLASWSQGISSASPTLVPGTDNLYIWNYSEFDTLNVTHSDAFRFCNSHGEGWRLPTTKELEYLWQYRYELNFSARHYWTSEQVNHKLEFYYVNFTNGKTGTEPYKKKNYVRCVLTK